LTLDNAKPITYVGALTHGPACLAHLSTARRDAELLLLHATGRDRAFLLTHPDTELTPAQQATYEQSLARRAQHEPIQYITGEQEFYGLTLRVTPDVLIPRPETEHLVEALLARIPHDAPLRIADVGTGSGAIAIALAHKLRRAAITALDISAPALKIARENAERHNVADRIRFLESDLLIAVVREKFDVIVSNPPYIPESEVLEPQVRDFEPPIALYAGKYGLDIYRRLIPQARQALDLDGWLLMEIGHDQSEDLIELLHLGFASDFVPDLQGIPRVAIARPA
jgi:release factor glutamine methyltransferase